VKEDFESLRTPESRTRYKEGSDDHDGREEGGQLCSARRDGARLAGSRFVTRRPSAVLFHFSLYWLLPTACTISIYQRWHQRYSEPVVWRSTTPTEYLQ
jgi:hypothetical protein